MLGVALLGFILERLLLTPLYSDTTERKDEYGLIVTFGLAFFLRNIAVLIFGPFPLRPPSFADGVQHVGGLILSNDRIVAGGVGALMIVALLYFMNYTIWGQALDAVSQSRESAAIVGISPRRFNSAAFCIGAGLAAAGGARRSSSTRLPSASAPAWRPRAGRWWRRSTRCGRTWASCRTSTRT